MSQFFVDPSAAPPPPGTVTDLTGDTGTNPVPPDGANNINIFGDTAAPGIVTRGDIASNTLFVGLAQATVCGTGSTINTATVDLVTLALGASAATYSLNAIVAGKAATQSGVGGTAAGTFKTDGATATLINSVDLIINRDLVVSGASFTLVVSGGNVILRATGSLGTVINWKGCITYTSVTAGV
jgi:hypothetical protein